MSSETKYKPILNNKFRQKDELLFNPYELSDQ
jgi:hypothetical protein